ncbi:MFS transporter [Rhodoluna lacicola]|uniref:Arabinose efflux permease n=1 Tax=Rhodoluna lacicola TaxID=529884 RepID=A0A060JMQ0_9MICO|nr:MFS transporter [Rhodoluna lacicola]AIC47863.1 Arabinose efflux permease [Rhodoluna lacicola]
MDEKEVNILQRRTVRVLTGGQILGGFALGSTLSIGSLLAASLSGSPAWAGSAATFSTLGAATWAIPLARLANSHGRKVSLAAGAALAIFGAIFVITAAAIGFFPLLLLALFMLGGGSAAGLQARFAAVDLDSASSRSTGRDLATVVWATTIGAVIGPNLFGPGEFVGRLLGLPQMTGPFLFTIVAQFSAAAVFWFGLRPDPLLVAKDLNKAKGGLKPKVSIQTAFATLRAYPTAAFAVVSIALSHMVMVAVMSMTPLHMHHLGYDLVVVGFTISLHIAGMYAFSPIFGWLSDRFGKIRIVLLGQLIYVAALATAGFGQDDRTLVTLGLFLLGLGWSASTVSSSALLAKTLPAEEKTNVQGLSDTSMNLAGALGGAVSGSILASVAFLGLNAAAFIPVSLILIFSGVVRLRSNQQS